MTGLLIFIGLILVILNVLSIKKQNKSFKGALGNAIENTNDYDIRIGELRREFSESILELQSELVQIKEIMKKNEVTNKNLDISYIEQAKHRENIEEIDDENENEIIIDEVHNKNSEKLEEIKRLFAEGLSVGEISEILHLGKGEVLLIKDLYIR
ncbi:DUF6115 domain-containing protein [Clostridium tagluense]|uniref:Resolvase HTH domain-containing protein n=1 Tax=Clostridium tagluense TaxID=360422 RepID=A0A401UHD3_9CLOT|nr:hypothetical protein [Clostridium tagluense]GCD08955.1 hypothetical protein Ctaglu_05780 [Clostridium tagluense]